jgi:hypothetical protein
MFHWYGFLNLPAPFSNRHFVFRTIPNLAMAEATGGALWERTWFVEPDGVATMRPLVAQGLVPGLTLKSFDSAIYVPTNTGAWLALALSPHQSLLGYHVSTSLGGDLPDILVNRYMYWSLGRLISEVVERAAVMPSHYTAGHPPIVGADGVAIPLY